ncbi:MAG: hypothetical protein ACKVQR_13315 [Aquabacterium sp.]
MLFDPWPLPSKRSTSALRLATCAALALPGCSAPAQTAVTTPATQAPVTAPPAACSGPAFRQLDFWLGHWSVRWDASPGLPAGSGTNTVTSAYGGCVVQEAFNGGASTGGLVGHSVSVYHAPVQRWRQTWVDNQGGYFALVGGPEGDRFVLVSSRLKEGTPAQRMVFEAITERSLTWRWQVTPDAGATWSDRWVIYYSRVQP